jgi:diketogulonate reductase-like aldo/keto reductase
MTIQTNPGAKPNRGENLGGSFTFPSTSFTVNRMGYGAMQLAGTQVWGPPRDRDAALAVLREAVASGVNHIDTSDFYGPHVSNYQAGVASLSGWLGDRHKIGCAPRR